MAVIKKIASNKYWWRFGEKGTIVRCWGGDVNWCNHCGKQIAISQNIKNTTAIWSIWYILLDIYPKKIKALIKEDIYQFSFKSICRTFLSSPHVCHQWSTSALFCIIIQLLIQCMCRSIVSLELCTQIWGSFSLITFPFGASLVAQRLKCLPGMQETQVQSLGQEDPLEKEMATDSRTLA